MIVKWVYDHTLISPLLTSISPSLTSILPLLAWSKPSFAHLTIIEKLHRLHCPTWYADQLNGQPTFFCLKMTSFSNKCRVTEMSVRNLTQPLPPPQVTENVQNHTFWLSKTILFGKKFPTKSKVTEISSPTISIAALP